MKRFISIFLVSATVILMVMLIYALVYAKPESSWRKDIFVIGIFFMATGRFTLSFLRRNKVVRF